MKTEQIHPKIWKFTGFDNVNAYFIDAEKKIFVDCGNKMNHAGFKKEVAKVVNPAKVDIVLFTHLHYDHAGNFDVFPNAKFYASEKEIYDFKKCAPFYPDKGLLVKLKPLPGVIEGIRVVHTPGHTKDSICFHADNILITGDTLFNGTVGNCFSGDLDGFLKSLTFLLSFPDETLIYAGHDYVSESMNFAKKRKTLP